MKKVNTMVNFPFRKCYYCGILESNVNENLGGRCVHEFMTFTDFKASKDVSFLWLKKSIQKLNSVNSQRENVLFILRNLAEVKCANEIHQAKFFGDKYSILISFNEILRNVTSVYLRIKIDGSVYLTDWPTEIGASLWDYFFRSKDFWGDIHNINI